MRPFFITIFLLPLFVSAQRIKVNKYDKFIKKIVIETSTSVLRQDAKGGMSISFKSVGADCFTTLRGYGNNAATVNINDEVIFLLDNDSTVIVKSIGLQTYEPGMGKRSDSYSHEYTFPYSSLELLSQHNVVGIRKYNVKGYTDSYISHYKQGEIRNMCLLLLSDMAKAKVLIKEKPVAKMVASKESIVYVKAINLDDISKYVGENVTVCSKVYTARYLSSSKTKPTLLNIGAAYPNQMLTVIISDSDREAFGVEPETFFLNKDVCITGKVELYNDKPQISVHTKGQITLNKEVTIKGL